MTPRVAADAPDGEAVALRHGVRVLDTDAAIIVSEPGGAALRLTGLSPPVRSTLLRLARGPIEATALAGDLAGGDRQQGELVRRRLWSLLGRSVLHAGREVLRVEARSPVADYAPAVLGPDTPVRLSAFAYVHTRGGMLVLESPLTPHRGVPLDPHVRSMIVELGVPTTPGHLSSPDLPTPVSTRVLAHLAGAGMVDVGRRVGGDVRFPADSDEALRQWEFHDLLLHTRSRTGRHDEPSGPLFTYAGTVPPAPALTVTPDPPARAVELHRPRMTDLLRTDPTLVAAMETRRSVRRYGRRPVTAAELGDFLYRVARVRATCAPRPPDVPYEVTDRPYPGAGATYELELYVVVRRCDGIDSSIYRYDPAGHRLLVVNDDPADREWMVSAARLAAGDRDDPDVAISITARFPRVTWKYRSMAYAVVLKDVGVLYQSMYLVATAMNLAPCALGSGSLDRAARILGLDWLTESPVGEFLLGTPPRAAAAGRGPAPRDGWTAVNDPPWEWPAGA